jgi:hypothetical protein
MIVTDFRNVCEILGKLYSVYKDDEEFKDFIEFNDLGLPLAYFVSENLCEVADDGARYITETWALFLAGLNLEDTGFSNLDEVFESAEEKNNGTE